MFTKSKIFGLIVFSFSLMSFSSPVSASATAIAKSTTTPVVQSANVEKTIKSKSSATDAKLAETLYKTFEQIDNQPCDDRKTVTEKGVKYSVCTANAGGRGQFRFISASASITEGDGISYWYYLNGKVAAIRFFHTSELFIFNAGGKLQAELIPAQKIMVNGEEQFQKRSARTKFSQRERDRLEKLAKGGGKEILSKFK